MLHFANKPIVRNTIGSKVIHQAFLQRITPKTFRTLNPPIGAGPIPVEPYYEPVLNGFPGNTKLGAGGGRVLFTRQYVGTFKLETKIGHL